MGVLKLIQSVQVEREQERGERQVGREQERGERELCVKEGRSLCTMYNDTDQQT